MYLFSQYEMKEFIHLHSTVNSGTANSRKRFDFHIYFANASLTKSQ